MSLSKPTGGPKNPAKKYFQFSGRRVIDNPEEGELSKPTDGKFYYYDKEQEKNIPVENLPPFIVLDGYGFDGNLFTITGFLESYKAYCWSNEVRSVEDKVVVRLFDKQKTVVGEGAWSDIGQELKNLGCKYTKSIYVMFKGTNEIANIKFAGGALSSWLEIDTDEERFRKRYVVVKDITKDKKGDTKFWKLSLDFGDEFSEDDLNNAMALDAKLQEYLAGYLKSDPRKAVEYDRSETNTDSWAFVAVEGDENDRELNELSLSELNAIREGLEADNQEDSTYYQFVCRACKEKREEQKEETTSNDVKKDPKDLFRKKKEEPKQEEKNDAYKNVELPDGRTVGDLDKEEVEELKSYLEENKMTSDHKEIYEALCDADAANTIPF